MNLTEHQRHLRREALRMADHPFRVDRHGDHCPGGLLTVYAADTGAPVGFAVRVGHGWNDPDRWSARLILDGEQTETGRREYHRCAEDAELSIRRMVRIKTGGDAYAGANLNWITDLWH